MRILPAALLAVTLSAAPALAQQCGGDFSSFVNGLRSEAVSRGHSQANVDAFFRSVRFDQSVINADRRQGVFQLPFTEFSRRVISQNRITNGARNSQRYDAVFDVAERQFGVSRGVLLAFWALETDYGAVQGDFNTLNALVTLSHDCRRPQLFRPQIFAALELFENGDFDPATTTGAWAGEIGMVQMLPEDILNRGVDGDGDGHVTLKTSPADALLSGANMLRGLGWRANEPWLVEISVPGNLDWAQTGLDTTRRVSEWEAAGIRARTGSLPGRNLQASVLLPQGRNGPAFLAYPNFNVFFEWNQSFVYVTTAAYFATRLEGAPVYNAGGATGGLSPDQMRQLQQRLVARGHDVGGVDGILGRMTRAAVQSEQQRLGLPADAWPTVELLRAL
ncbi:MAG: lytic murein transglycosylase [Roseicyclus sp.]|nr:lytic murein transglycosylase [Roseicyclus sp.]MBO6625916.1 lytic murein transglycosylase [Roseicyclus sp.]MBO6923481.1 lytic murein transglycosylase [Roseicyclus sp.]